MTRGDRAAVFAHYRAKELRNVADAMRTGDLYTARLARKRLDRVDELARVFAEIERYDWLALQPRLLHSA